MIAVINTVGLYGVYVGLQAANALHIHFLTLSVRF